MLHGNWAGDIAHSLSSHLLSFQGEQWLNRCLETSLASDVCLCFSRVKYCFEKQEHDNAFKSKSVFRAHQVIVLVNERLYIYIKTLLGGKKYRYFETWTYSDTSRLRLLSRRHSLAFLDARSGLTCQSQWTSSHALKNPVCGGIRLCVCEWYGGCEWPLRQLSCRRALTAGQQAGESCVDVGLASACWVGPVTLAMSREITMERSNGLPY